MEVAFAFGTVRIPAFNYHSIPSLALLHPASNVTLQQQRAVSRSLLFIHDILAIHHMSFNSFFDDILISMCPAKH